MDRNANNKTLGYDLGIGVETQMIKEQGLVVENLSKTFYAGERTIKALEEISLTVGPGEFFNIIGPSGCGKSTLLRCIAGFEKPTEGRIRLNGDRIKEPEVNHMMVFQDFDQLFPWYTVRKNVIFALEVAAKLKNSKEKQESAEHYLDLVGLRGFEDFYPHQLSGGMKQRVAIARALSVRPGILLMDEPFGSLNAITRSTLQEELIRIWQETKVTIIFVTHNIEEAIMLGDRILLLQANPGRVNQVIQNPLARPRSQDSPNFGQIWDRIHSLLSFDRRDKIKEEKSRSKLFEKEALLEPLALK